ncbi:MAG: metal ABC transporter substrate-binding protein [Nitrososphaeria archaeon]
MKALAAIVALTMILLLTGIPGHMSRAQGGLKVAATISSIASIVGPVLSNDDELAVLLPSTVEPHSFALDPMTIQKALEADILVSSGHIGWERQLETQLLENGKVVFDPLGKLNSSMVILDSPSGGRNVHGYWLLPENVKLISYEFAKMASKLNPSMAETYMANQERYVSEIDKLQAFAVDSMAKRGLLGRGVIIGFYEEQYVAESFGLKVNNVLAGEEESLEISPQKLDEIRDNLSNGTAVGMLVSDIALQLPLNDYIMKLAEETGKPVYYVRTLDIPSIYDFRELYTLNLGNILSSDNVPNEKSYALAPDVYWTAIAISVMLNIIFGYLLLVRGRR